MRMDENTNPEWKAMLKSSYHGRRALLEIENLRQERDEWRRRAEYLWKWMKDEISDSRLSFLKDYPKAAGWFEEEEK